MKLYIVEYQTTNEDTYQVSVVADSFRETKQYFKQFPDILQNTLKYVKRVGELTIIKTHRVDRKVLGYRYIGYGDEYNYGHYADYLLKDYPDAKARAEKLVAESQNGGHISPIYWDTPKEGKVY